MTPRVTAFLALSILILGAGGLLAHEGPPRNLRLVGDHWTPWEPPTSFPEGAEVYIIQKGDTLWDLSNQFYGDPYLWPQLWERNRYILDAHWIYPGDPLVVGVEVTPIEELAEEVAEEVDPLGLDRSVSAPVPLGSEDDIYCSGYIGPANEVFDFQITGSEVTYSLQGTTAASAFMYGSAASAVMNLSTGDIVYLDGGRQAGLMAGSVFTVVRPQGEVRHPRSHKPVGEYYRYMGRLRVLSVQEGSGIAEILHTCHPVQVGDWLKPFTPEPVPLARRSGLIGINDPVPASKLEDSPFIILSNEGLLSLGEGHVVYIDRGAEDNVAPGDLYTIYRETPSGVPPIVVGELAVLSVREQASLAKILESRYTVYVGDRLDQKGH